MIGVWTTPEVEAVLLMIFLPLGKVSSIKFSQGLLQTQYSSLILVIKSVKVKQLISPATILTLRLVKAQKLSLLTS